MRFQKKYGQSRTECCPFCGKQGILNNSQKIPVCSDHKNSELKDMKCLCGEWLDLKHGKFGPYFSCMNCGNVNFKKGLEMNPTVKPSQQVRGKIEEREDKKMIVSEKENFIYVPSIDLYVAKERSHLGLNWHDAHKKLHEEGLLMPTIPQFLEFIKYLE